MGQKITPGSQHPTAHLAHYSLLAPPISDLAQFIRKALVHGSSGNKLILNLFNLIAEVFYINYMIEKIIKLEHLTSSRRTLMKNFGFRQYFVNKFEIEF